MELQEQLDSVRGRCVALESQRAGNQHLELSLQQLHQQVILLQHEKEALLQAREKDILTIQVSNDTVTKLQDVKYSLEQQLRAAEASLRSLQQQLVSVHHDLSVLEKTMDQNHLNISIGANTDSCVGLAELREKEIHLLQTQIKAYEDDQQQHFEHNHRIEMECARRVLDAERKTAALFGALGNGSISAAMLETQLSNTNAKELDELRRQIDDLQKVEDKLEFQLKLADKMSQQVCRFIHLIFYIYGCSPFYSFASFLTFYSL